MFTIGLERPNPAVPERDLKARCPSDIEAGWIGGLTNRSHNGRRLGRKHSFVTVIAGRQEP